MHFLQKLNLRTRDYNLSTIKIPSDRVGVKLNQNWSHFFRIRNEFGTALFRWGHSMQPNNIQSRDVFFNHQETRLLRSNYFDPKILTRRSPGGLLRGGMMTNGVTAGPKWVDDTVHFFFQGRFSIFY